jgi:outer membrane protein OmpA-like peptidoglycan-associated protein
MRETTPPAIRFRTTVESEAGIASWHLTAMQDGRLLKDFNGEGSVPEVVDWKVEAEQGTVPRAPGVVLYQLNLRDNSGQQHQTAVGELPVEQVTVRKKRNERVADVNIERYNLILFDYDRAELGAENRRLVEEVRERITPESHVKITGYTDRIGDAAYNERLALDRARAVASSLKLNESQVEVGGETVPLYDQTLPEGRFNSRSVTIEIETPVKDGDSG